MNLKYLLPLLTILTFFVIPNKAIEPEKINYFLEKTGLQKTDFHLNEAKNGNYHITNLDDKRDLFVLWRKMLLKITNKFQPILHHMNWKEGKVQDSQRLDQFPCSLNDTRSPVRPVTVHQLRPGDIDVVAAIGDSLTAGNGAMSATALGAYTELRGMSFSGGGMENWSTMLTLPNILKVFNPSLYGYATENVLARDKGAYLNVAEPMMLSRDLVFQVQVLIQRMRRDSRIDMKNHWKLVTIFVGSNDFCTDMCHHDNMLLFLKNHEEDLYKALTVLRNNVPHLVVNLIPAPNMVYLQQQMENVPGFCKIPMGFTCSCLVNRFYSPEYLQKASELITHWQAIDEQVASLAEFQTDDFAVLYHSFMANMTIPKLLHGGTDLRYFGKDCVHFSQFGHAAMANLLWNNMLQENRRGDVELKPPFDRFECPTAERPFIATMKNKYWK